MTVKARNSANAPTSGPAPATAALVPFTRASRQKTILSFALSPITLGAGAVPFGPIQVPANGFLRAINLEVAITSTGNSATVALNADQPFNILNSLSVTSSSGDALLTPIDGYALFTVIKYGAFGSTTPFCDPRSDPTFATSATGTGGTAGTMLFRLRIPFEIDSTTAFCSVPNLASNRSYNIQGLFSALATAFATAPNGTVTATLTATAEYWSVPNPASPDNEPQEVAPLGNGSYHVIQVENVTISSGGGLYPSHNVGNVIRQIIVIYRSTAGARITMANLPGIIEFVLNNDVLFYQTRNEYQRNLAATGYGAAYGAVAAAVNTAQGQDDGVIVYTQFLASGQAVIDSGKSRNQYLPTLDSTLIQFRGTTWSAAGTLQMITSSVVPTSSMAMFAPHIS